MGLLWAVIVWAVFGLVCGALARLLIPGRQPMSWTMTMLLGIVGSFIGGFIAYLFNGGEPLQASGFIMSLLGAVVALWGYMQFGSRQTVDSMPRS